MERTTRELGEQTEKFGGKSKQSTNHKSMEVCYEENLELVDRSEDSEWASSLEMLRDLEGEVGQEVVRVDSGGSSRSGLESLKQLANVELLVGGDDMKNSTMMTKKG